MSELVIIYPPLWCLLHFFLHVCRLMRQFTTGQVASGFASGYTCLEESNVFSLSFDSFILAVLTPRDEPWRLSPCPVHRISVELLKAFECI